MMEMNTTVADEYREAIQHLEEAVRHLKHAESTGYEMALGSGIAVGAALEQVREDAP